MALPPLTPTKDRLAFSSSLRDNVWHPQKNDKSYEWWYFDALSDDGSEGVIIVFLDNFIYSPQYNREKQAEGLSLLEVGEAKRFPAVSFTYFRNGKPLYRFLTEFPETEFSASESVSECTIGDSSFKFTSAPYGSGYTVFINGLMRGKQRLEAHFEWLSIESDMATESFCYYETAHCWNMAVPRADVTGRITVSDHRGKTLDVRHFRGTGYHDHRVDNRWLVKTIDNWHWGRVHFADSTAVFCHYCEIDDRTPATKLLVVRNGELSERAVDYEEQNYARNSKGIRYPTRLRLVSEDNMRLRVKPIRIIDSSFYYLRFLSEMTLTLRDGIPRKTTGITEFLSTRNLNFRLVNWLNDLRTSRYGRSPRI